MLSETFWIWLVINIVSLLSLSAYSMMEMACISFDRIRLQYFLTKGDYKMIWLNDLVSNSGRLFGTTLIGVNIALVVGSESARQIFSTLGFSPEFSVIPQILVVILFGELAPMFAARRYPEHVVQIGIGLIYTSSKILAPILWLINLISKSLTGLFDKDKVSHEAFLARDELQKILEVHEEPTAIETEELSQTISNIFTISPKSAFNSMRPLKDLHLIPSNCTAGELRKIVLHSKQEFYPIKQEKTNDVVGIVYPRDILRIADNRRVRDYAQQPWFIEHQMRLLDVLKQFRSNNESLAIVLDQKGKTIGYISLDHIIDSIFGSLEDENERHSMTIVERTIDPNIKIGELEVELGVDLNLPKEADFADICREKLEDNPQEGDTFSIGPYEVTILESTVFELKRVKIKTKLF